jgi:hypothetical protein
MAALVIAGCGGSKPTTSTSSTTNSSASSTTTSTSTPTTPTTPGTTSTPATKTPTTTTQGSGGVSAQPSTTGASGGSSPGTKVKNPAGGSGNARVPATFTIRAGGSVTPPTVSAPAFLAVQLTVVSGDGRPHKVGIQTPPSQRALSVPAHGHASVLLPGLKAGDYAVQIDGVPRAKLVIGGEPGP